MLDLVEWQRRRSAASRGDGLEQVADSNPEGAGQADEYIRTGVGLSKLDPANVLVVQAGEFRERFLRHLAIEPETAQLCTERPQDGRTRGRFTGSGVPGRHRLLCTAQPWSREPPIGVTGV
jgi:hypothetical protein